MEPDCPIDHEIAEKVVESLPGPVKRGVYFSVGALTISPRLRTTSVATLWIFIGLSAFLLQDHLWVIALLLLIAAGVTRHLVALPAKAATSPLSDAT